MGFTATTYIVSYPILVYDRIHFLQFQVSGGDGEGLVELWTAWLRHIHEDFWTSPAKAFLQEALQQLLLAYFESRWIETLRSHLLTCPVGALPTIDDRYEELIQNSFATTGNLLVPLQKLARNGKTYAYRPYTWDLYLNSRKDLTTREIKELLKDENPQDSLRNGLGSKWEGARYSGRERRCSSGKRSLR